MVFGLFSKEKKLKKMQKRVLNKLAQSPDRWAAMEYLREDGSDEALLTLFQRFAITSTKEIEDLQEKEWVVEVLSAKGTAVLPAMRTCMKNSLSIAYPLKILGNIAERDKLLEVIDELLADEDVGYTRDPAKRIQIIDWLADWRGVDDSEIVRRVAPYVVDFDENVRFAAANCIALHVCDDAAQPLVDALLRPEEESRRLKIRIAEILAHAELGLCGRKSEVSELCGDVLSEFKLKRDKLIRKR